MKSLIIVHTVFLGLFVSVRVASTTAAELNFTVTPFAGAASTGSADGRGANARFNRPQGILLDAAGNLLIADTGNSTIRKISPDGLVSTYSGVVEKPYSGDVEKSATLNGPLATAQFNGPTGLAQDRAGNLYVADEIMIRKITPDGVVSTLAGWPPNLNAFGNLLFHGTSSLAVDATGNVYIAAFYRYQNYSVTRVTSDGTDTSLYVGTNDWPQGVTLDPAGKIFYTTSGSGYSEGISSLAPDNTPTRLAGGGKAGAVDATGTSASFNSPAGLKFAANGNLYVADAGNNKIRIVTPTGEVHTLAGVQPTPGDLGDQGGLVDGNALTARFWSPFDVAIDPLNNVFVADKGNNAIRKITPTGDVSTIAGLYPASGENINGTGAAARFSAPSGVGVSPAGDLYIADTKNYAVRKVSPTGAVTSFATTHELPSWTTVDSTGNVYVSEDRGVVEKFTSTGSNVPFSSTFASAAGVAVDLAGNVFVADTISNVIHKITPGGSISDLNLTVSPGDSVLLKGPLGITLDATGNLYVVNEGRESTGVEYPGVNFAYISKIDSNGLTSVIAGLPNGWIRDTPDDSNGPQRALTIATPRAIAVGPEGNVYVTTGSTYYNIDAKLFKITPSGDLTQLALQRSDGRTEGLFGSLAGVAIDRLGALYVTDNAINFNLVSKITPSGALPVIITQPQNQTVVAGGSVQLSVSANGNPAPTYQWYFNQTAISGATSSSYGLTNVQAKDAGDYSVIVANTWGQITSAKVTLTLGTVTTSPPATTPGKGSMAGSSGGGGIEAWFGILVLSLGVMYYVYSFRAPRWLVIVSKPMVRLPMKSDGPGNLPDGSIAVPTV